MSQVLKTRLNNLAADVSTLRSDKQSALTVAGTDATGSTESSTTTRRSASSRSSHPSPSRWTPSTTPSPSAGRVR